MNFKIFILCIFVPFCIYGAEASQNNQSQQALSIKLSTVMIDWYKENIAPIHPFQCTYYPSCSQYTKEAIEKYGLLKGWFLGCDRLMRCNHDKWVYSEVKVKNEIKKYNPVP